MAVFFSLTFLPTINLSAQSLNLLDRDISQIVNRVSKGVVTVEAHPPEGKIPLFQGQDLYRLEPVNAVVGSGLLIDSVGHILTILSLVDGYENFRVVMEGKSIAADLVGVDRRYNLAVLKIDSIFYDYLEMSSVPPLIGRLAIGYGQAIGRTGYPILGVIAGRRSDGSYLMSGSALPGLPGGGVFDLSGRLIGVISSGSAVSDDSGDNHWGGIVILPASIAYEAADRIICCGDYEAGYLGVKTTAIELVSADGKVMGEAVVISRVEPGSPAAGAGLRMGDIITGFASRPVIGDHELHRLVSSAGSDNIVKIKYIRGRKNAVAAIRLSSVPNQGNRSGKIDNERYSKHQSITARRLQRRIDSMRSELSRLQEELERLLRRVETTR